MNHTITEKILDAIRPVCDLSRISISTENKEWKNGAYKSDRVTIIQHHNVGFEVFDNEIRAFFFSDHVHFENYSSPSEDHKEYIARAIAFLKDLFTYPILHITTIKGGKTIKEEYFFVKENGQEESLAGPTMPLFKGNPFAKKTITREIWQYDIAVGDYSKAAPISFDPTAIYSTVLGDNIYFEIFKKNGVFSYVIMIKTYDDYDGMYYWTAYDNGTLSLFDTKEKAIEAAEQEIKLNNLL